MPAKHILTQLELPMTDFVERVDILTYSERASLTDVSTVTIPSVIAGAPSERKIVLWVRDLIPEEKQVFGSEPTNIRGIIIVPVERSLTIIPDDCGRFLGRVRATPHRCYFLYENRSPASEGGGQKTPSRTPSKPEFDPAAAARRAHLIATAKGQGPLTS